MSDPEGEIGAEDETVATSDELVANAGTLGFGPLVLFREHTFGVDSHLEFADMGEEAEDGTTELLFVSENPVCCACRGIPRIGEGRQRRGGRSGQTRAEGRIRGRWATHTPGTSAVETLAGRRAGALGRPVQGSLITLLLEAGVPDTIATANRSCALDDDVGNPV